MHSKKISDWCQTKDILQTLVWKMFILCWRKCSVSSTTTPDNILTADLNTAFLLKNNKKAKLVKLHRNSAVPVQIKLPVTVVGFVIWVQEFSQRWLSAGLKRLWIKFSVMQASTRESRTSFKVPRQLSFEGLAL